MSDRLIPASATRAATRGFIRTASQSLSAFIPTSVVAVVLSGEWLLSAVLGIASALVTAALSGAQSYFSILSSGIPEDYKAREAPGD